MKHENECLWRELAVIRQKHMKQQRILNQVWCEVFLLAIVF